MKPIKLTQSTIAKAKENILAQLDGVRLQGTKVSLSYDFTDAIKEQLENTEVKTPIVYMMANTYLKMLEYVMQCDTEIAWHGTVKRGEGDKKHIFFIKDVYLYPQKIAAATVQVDDTKYTQWSDAQDAETFNNRRFQGHSHVNMGTTYSGIDEANKKEFLQDLLDDDYYIFVVTNKRQEHNFEVYDLAQNIIFENKDIDFRVYLNENTLLESIDDEMSRYLTKPTYSYTPTPNYYKGPTTPAYGSKTYEKPKTKQYSFYSNYNDDYNDNDDDYYTKLYGNVKKTTANTKIKRHVVLMNRAGRNFEKEYREYEGEITKVRFNGKDYEVFIPYKPFETDDIQQLRKEGWHVREMPIPVEFDI